MHRLVIHPKAIASPAGLMIAMTLSIARAPAQENGDPAPVRAERKAKQITIQTDDRPVKLAFSSYSDKLAGAFRGLIQERDAWVYPIDIIVRGNMNDVISGRHTANQVTQLPDQSFRLGLHVRLSAAFQWELFSKALIRVLLHEQMLRRFQSQPETASGKTLAEVPWLVEGIEQLLTQRRTGRASDLYAGILNSRRALSIREILSADLASLDPVSKDVFNASSAALISALLNQPGGAKSFRKFVRDLAGIDPGEIEQLLRRHFPGFRGSPEAMEKWWSLEIASLGQQQAFEYFSPEQTEALLDEALVVRFGVEPKKDPKGVMKYLPHFKPAAPFEGRLQDFEQFEGRRDCEEVLQHNLLQLQALAIRCFPLYRDILRGYEEVIDSIIEDKTRGLKEKLKSIDEARAAVRRTMSYAGDYLNYYEATRATGKSEAYRQYRLTREKLEQQGRPARKDRISTYLDAMEAEFGRDE